MFWSNLYGKKCIFKVFIEEKKGKKCIFKVFIEKKKFQLPSLRKKFFLRLDKSQVSGKSFSWDLTGPKSLFPETWKKLKMALKIALRSFSKIGNLDLIETFHFHQITIAQYQGSGLPPQRPGFDFRCFHLFVISKKNWMLESSKYLTIHH